MLDNLSVQQVEKALEWLAQPVQCHPPQDLEKLDPLEWFLLERMLQALWQEKNSSPMH
jgi:hypothetical protein